MATIKIEDKILKTISEIAKEENTTENHIINKYLKKGIENDHDDEYTKEEEEELLKDIKEAEQGIKEGRYVRLDIDSMDERYS
jgi:hypothetical protein